MSTSLPAPPARLSADSATREPHAREPRLVPVACRVMEHTDPGNLVFSVCALVSESKSARQASEKGAEMSRGESKGSTRCICVAIPPRRFAASSCLCMHA